MAELRVNPTRMELKRLKARLTTARRGHKLLKDKRDELMKQFIELVRENRALRIRVEEKLAAVHASFGAASAAMSPEVLEEALLVPKREGSLDVSYRNMMSVLVPKYRFDIDESNTGDAAPYGFAFTSDELDEASRELAAMLPDLLKLAEAEKAAQMLADEIEKTRRRVNALEYIMIPQLETAIKSIVMKLDENERGNLTRLMKVKDLMLARAQNERRNAEE